MSDLPVIFWKQSLNNIAGHRCSDAEPHGAISLHDFVRGGDLLTRRNKTNHVFIVSQVHVATDSKLDTTSVDNTVGTDEKGQEWVQIAFPEAGWVCLNLTSKDHSSVFPESRSRNSALYQLSPPLGTLAMNDKEREQYLESLKRNAVVDGKVPPDCIKLYHQTTPDAAKEILNSEKMARGSSGAVGGGIYFALSPQETHPKAHHKCVVLECLVYVGNIQVTRSTQYNYTFSELMTATLPKMAIIVAAMCFEIEMFVA